MSFSQAAIDKKKGAPIMTPIATNEQSNYESTMSRQLENVKNYAKTMK